MRNFFKSIKDTFQAVKAKFSSGKAKARRKIQRTLATVRTAAYHFAVRFCMRTAQARFVLAETRGENFVDSGIKILIAVVIGALLLGGLYALFGDTIMPTVTEKVKKMFEFKG